MSVLHCGNCPAQSCPSQPSRLVSAVAACATHGSAVAQTVALSLQAKHASPRKLPSKLSSLSSPAPAPAIAAAAAAPAAVGRSAAKPRDVRTALHCTALRVLRVPRHALRCCVQAPSVPMGAGIAAKKFGFRDYPVVPTCAAPCAAQRRAHARPFTNVAAASVRSIRRLRPAQRRQRSRTRWSRLGAWLRALRRRRPLRLQYQPGPLKAVLVAHAFTRSQEPDFCRPHRIRSMPMLLSHPLHAHRFARRR